MNNQIDTSIFKAYDIRGVAGDNLSEEIVESIGKAFGTFIVRKGGVKMVVGEDIRESSPAYKAALIKGINSTGVDVLDMGVIVTPNLYYASNKYDVAGGAMITASHNPAEYNGVKMTYNKSSLTSDNIQVIKDMVVEEDFIKGQGKVEEFDQAREDYLEEINQNIGLTKKMKIVVDPSNSVAATVLPRLSEIMDFELAMVNDNIDSKFSAHPPDPVVMDNYKDLRGKMMEIGADMGAMFDGDADRVGFVDEKGQVWLGDKIQMLLARDILPHHRGAKVIVELKNSEAVVEEVKRLGGEPIFGKTGHTLIEEKLHEVGAILAAEMSCHYYIADQWYKFDDALYAMARVMKIVADSGRKFSELMEELPDYPATPEYRLTVPEERKLAIVEELVDYFKAKCDHYLDLDGIRGYKFGGWFLIRSSNTQPMISIRVEGKDEKSLEEVKNFVKEKIDQVEGVNLDWDRQHD